jgi:hypothetical protein
MQACIEPGMKLFYKNRTNYILSKKGGRSEAGFSYMAILILLAIMSTLTFSFLFKVGTQTQATMTRGQGMQADYLAETAASHALWGLLNQPDFAPASDVYYMHSLANGRYGYKVRKPTETTFATVATVGAVENNVVNQSYVQYIIPSNVFTAYGSSTNTLPLYRRLIGADWTDPGDMQVGGTDTIYWLELEGCPIRKELVGGIIDSADEVTGLSTTTSYTYRVKARDKSASHNETDWSTEASASTPSNEIYVYDITMGFRTAPGNKYFGRATVWIKSADGANISSATVSGDWSGAVSESGMGSTGADGKVTLESSNKKNGGTFTFTVTSVLKTGYTYNPSMNVETSDTIIAP